MNVDDLIQYVCEESLLIGMRMECRAFILINDRHIGLKYVDESYMQRKDDYYRYHDLLEAAFCNNNIFRLFYLLPIEKERPKFFNNFFNNNFFLCACLNGHINLVNFLISIGVTTFEEGFKSACLGGQSDLVKILLSRNFRDCHRNGIEIEYDWNAGLKSACIGGHLDLAKFLMSKGAGRNSSNVSNCRYWNDALSGSSQGGNLELIELMISKGANDWEYAFRGACRGGHIELVKRFKRAGGFHNVEIGLRGACLGGHIEIIEYIIARMYTYHGDNHWNNGLAGACEGNNKSLIKLMISNGASYCNNCGSFKSIEKHLKFAREEDQ